jgi:hypothetical protein
MFRNELALLVQRNADLSFERQSGGGEFDAEGCLVHGFKKSRSEMLVNFHSASDDAFRDRVVVAVEQKILRVSVARVQ